MKSENGMAAEINVCICLNPSRILIGSGCTRVVYTHIYHSIANIHTSRMHCGFNNPLGLHDFFLTLTLHVQCARM